MIDTYVTDTDLLLIVGTDEKPELIIETPNDEKDDIVIRQGKDSIFVSHDVLRDLIKALRSVA